MSCVDYPFFFLIDTHHFSFILMKEDDKSMNLTKRSKKEIYYANLVLKPLLMYGYLEKNYILK